MSKYVLGVFQAWSTNERRFQVSVLHLIHVEKEKQVTVLPPVPLGFSPDCASRKLQLIDIVRIINLPWTGNSCAYPLSLQSWVQECLDCGTANWDRSYSRNYGNVLSKNANLVSTYPIKDFVKHQ
jgi:hypothetical protein